MNQAEARRLLAQHLAQYRRRSYGELVALIGNPSVIEVTGPSGVRYQIEVEALWDSQPNGYVRVMAAIDDGGWRAFVPLTDDFIVGPDGRFVGE